MNQRGSLLLFTIILTAMILVGLIGSYLFILQINPRSSGIQESSTSAKISQESTSPPTKNSSALQVGAPNEITPNNLPIQLTDEWKYQVTKKCKIKIPVPPNKPPFILNGDSFFWKVDSSEIKKFDFTQVDRIFLTYPGHANGGDSGSVTVYCTPNSSNLTTQAYMKTFENNIEQKIYSSEVMPRAENLKILDKQDYKLGSQDVILLHIEGGFANHGDHYLLANKKMIYLIKVSESMIPNIQNTLKVISDNMTFVD